MPTTTHAPNITVNVSLAALPPSERGFSSLLLLVPLASNSLNGTRVVTYTDYADAESDATAGYISASTLSAMSAAFGQARKPAEVKVGYVDIAGGEDYGEGLVACLDVDDDVYGVCAATRVPSEIATLAAAVNTASLDLLYMAQDNDSAWLTSSAPSAYASVDEVENFGVLYHTTDTEWSDVAYLAQMLSFDPDTVSAPWNPVRLSGIAANSAVPTAAQRLQIIAHNVNLGLPFGGYDYVIDPGVTITGRPIYQILSAHWYSARIAERAAAMQVELAALGIKITVDDVGHARVAALAEALLDEGVRAGHFTEGTVTKETITASDRTNRRLRVTVRARVAENARLLTFNVNFSTTSITGA